jgi:hypothetical protein
MKKIPTIFKRDTKDRQSIMPEPNTACGWVFSGEGVATRKYDGTCCMVTEGSLYKRREVKKGVAPPSNFVQADADEITGKVVGWVPVDSESAEDTWYRAAFVDGMPDGTYELLGPKVQGNPEGLTGHVLLKHSDAEVFADVPRTFEALRTWLSGRDIEGIVFHHPDGRMAKIKKRDYGQLRRKQHEPTSAEAITLEGEPLMGLHAVFHGTELSQAQADAVLPLMKTAASMTANRLEKECLQAMEAAGCPFLGRLPERFTKHGLADR